MYRVKQKYFDNGKVKAEIIYLTDIDTEQIKPDFKEFAKYDLYVDYFSTHSEASKAYNQALRA